MAERLTASTQRTLKFGKCCKQGKIKLPTLQPVPQPLRHLLEDMTDDAKHFRDNIRQYNNAFAFTSVGVDVDNTLLNTPGPQVFKIHGALYHRHGALIPPSEDMTPTYAQLYIHDPTVALEYRLTHRANEGLNYQIFSDLQEMLLQCNPFVNIYRQAYERLKVQADTLRGQGLQQHIEDLTIRLTYKPFTDPRRYNPPTSDELALIMPGQADTVHKDNRDVIIQYRNGNFKRVHDGQAIYMPLHYVMFFPCGEPGWTWDIPYSDGHWQPGDNHQSSQNTKTVTQMQYYAYRLFPRHLEANTIFKGKQLFQQYIVDAWAATEQRRLQWILNQQEKLRAELYQPLRNALTNQNVIDPKNVGQSTIVPATFTGSTRDIKENLQNSFAIARKYGNASCFITMTANPNWEEIKRGLFPGQTAADRPDLVSRVFELKKAHFLHLITKEGILGTCLANVHVIEFQKRGLPHMHLLIWLKDEDKPKTPEDVYSIVSASFHDRSTHHQLYELVGELMTHGPCGTNNPCQSNL
jgi:hypothetical protein